MAEIHTACNEFLGSIGVPVGEAKVVVDSINWDNICEIPLDVFSHCSPISFAIVPEK